ncbi:hypothetical protein BV372_09030 [Nostoc sp. T09]|nr:hypothetical protein BV372_09030 [Nostoc sp. T09]
MKTKAQYKVKNWNAYDAALKQRGSITFWVNEEIIEQWRNQQKTGKKGASNYYSDVAMPAATRSGNATMGTIQSLFHLAGRQAEGFLESLFMLMGIELAVPDHSTLSRRLSKLLVELPVIPKKKAVHVVVDSTLGESLWRRRMESAYTWGWEKADMAQIASRS